MSGWYSKPPFTIISRSFVTGVGVGAGGKEVAFEEVFVGGIVGVLDDAYTTYTLRRLAPPQYSVNSPWQGVLQPVS